MGKDEDEDFYYFDIDLHQLQIEWQCQPRMFRKSARKLALAKSTVDECEAAVKLVRAELMSEVRDDPESAGLGKKPTVDAINRYVDGHADYIDALTMLNKAKKTQGLLDADVRTLEHRKASLENLVKLRLADYYADPKEPTGEEGCAVRESIANSVKKQSRANAVRNRAEKP